MKKNSKRTLIILGALCALSAALSAWQSITFNNSRLVVPMDFSKYTFRLADLPMILSICFFALYILCLFILLIRAANRKKTSPKSTGGMAPQMAAMEITRSINPKLGFLGFTGFLGFLGFWSYHVDKSVSPFVFFLFFGFFGFFYEGKMSGTLMDERFKENQIKARLAADKVSISIIFLSILVCGQGKLMGNLEYTLIAILIAITLSLALGQFLSEYLLYRYDRGDSISGSEE